MRHEADVSGTMKCRMVDGSLICEHATHRNMLYADINTLFPSVPEAAIRINAGETVYLTLSSARELIATVRQAAQ